MNDETLEQQLRDLPAPGLPAAWRAEILSAARREARPRQRPVWPPLLAYLRQLYLRHPLTAGALTALWLLIVFFKTSTPIDPMEKTLMAHYDPSRPVYLVSLQDEIRLAQLLQDQPGNPRQAPLIP